MHAYFYGRLAESVAIQPEEKNERLKVSYSGRNLRPVVEKSLAILEQVTIRLNTHTKRDIEIK